MTSLSTELIPGDIDRLAKWYWQCWMGMHWGFRRHAVIYWCCAGQISSDEALTVLGVNVGYPLDVVIFYRELAVTLTPEHELARKIVAMTPKPERDHIQKFYAGSNAFEKGKGSSRAIHKLIDEVTVPSGLPNIRLTDDGPASRVPSYRMVFDGLRHTVSVRGDNPPREPGETPLLFVSAECPELIAALPSLEYDPKNMEDIRQIGTLQDDVWSACMNAYREYPSVSAEKPIEVLRMEAVNRSSDPTQRYLNLLTFEDKFGNQSRPRKR